MKLLFDHNLSPRLVLIFADLYPNSQHVFPLQMDRDDDRLIWDYALQNDYTHILHQYRKTSKSRDLRVPTRGTPTQLTCRGAPCGYPGARVNTSIFKLVQDVSIQLLPATQIITI